MQKQRDAWRRADLAKPLLVATSSMIRRRFSIRSIRIKNPPWKCAVRRHQAAADGWAGNDENKASWSEHARTSYDRVSRTADWRDQPISAIRRLWLDQYRALGSIQRKTRYYNGSKQMQMWSCAILSFIGFKRVQMFNLETLCFTVIWRVWFQHHGQRQAAAVVLKLWAADLMGGLLRTSAVNSQGHLWIKFFFRCKSKDITLKKLNSIFRVLKWRSKMYLRINSSGRFYIFINQNNKNHNAPVLINHWLQNIRFKKLLKTKYIKLHSSIKTFIKGGERVIQTLAQKLELKSN